MTIVNNRAIKWVGIYYKMKKLAKAISESSLEQGVGTQETAGPCDSLNPKTPLRPECHNGDRAQSHRQIDRHHDFSPSESKPLRSCSSDPSWRVYLADIRALPSLYVGEVLQLGVGNIFAKGAILRLK